MAHLVQQGELAGDKLLLYTMYDTATANKQRNSVKVQKNCHCNGKRDTREISVE